MAVQAIVARQRREVQALLLQRAEAAAAAEKEARRELDAEEREQARRARRATLQLAMEAGDDELATSRVREVDPDLLAEPDAEGATALHTAAGHGLLDCVCAILQACEGVDLRRALAADRRGRTPLHRAAAIDSRGDICQELLACDCCDLRARDCDGWTALDVARFWGLPAAAGLILQATTAAFGEAPRVPFATWRPKDLPPGAAADVPKEKELAPEPVAAAADLDPLDLPWDHEACLEMVAEGRFNEAMALMGERRWGFTNEKHPKTGRTILHLAAEAGEAELCAAILARDDFEEADAWDNARATALHVAAARRHAECCRVIVDSGRFTAVNAGDLMERTALHLAAFRTDSESYDAIARHPDCDPTQPDKRGRSAVEYAAERGMAVELPAHLCSEVEL